MVTEVDLERPCYSRLSCWPLLMTFLQSLAACSFQETLWLSSTQWLKALLANALVGSAVELLGCLYFLEAHPQPQIQVRRPSCQHLAWVQQQLLDWLRAHPCWVAQLLLCYVLMRRLPLWLPHHQIILDNLRCSIPFLKPFWSIVWVSSRGPISFAS